MSKLALTAIIAAAGLIGAASAQADEPAKPARSCFFVTEWNGWSAPDDQTLLLKVNRDVYKVTLNSKSNALKWPGMHLVSVVRGSSSVCSARDLDLAVADGYGFREPLFLKSMDKLSSDEVAALPKKDRP
jgi:hypothetical protein